MEYSQEVINSLIDDRHSWILPDITKQIYYINRLEYSQEELKSFNDSLEYYKTVLNYFIDRLEYSQEELKSFYDSLEYYQTVLNYFIGLIYV